MEEQQSSRAIYSEHRAPQIDLAGLFTKTPFMPTPEDEILDVIRKGSKYKKQDMVAIGFGIVNSNRVLELEELYLTMTGFLESDHQRYAKNYQKLKAMFPRNKRLIHHLNDSKILGLNPDKKDRPLPYYFELDSERVLALYISKQNTCDK